MSMEEDIKEQARLLDKIEVTKDCWHWLGGKQFDGRGRFRYSNGKVAIAHLATYKILIGGVPEGTHLEHTCGNLGCVNPSHMRRVRNARDVRKQTGVKIKIGKL